MNTPSETEVQTAISQYIDELAQPLRELNRKVGIELYTDLPDLKCG